MIIDTTGTVLTPGCSGENCLGNGTHFDTNGILIECCCDECDWLMCCTETHSSNECINCDDTLCPNSPHCKKLKINTP